MAGRPRKHTSQMVAHKTKAELAARKQEEQAAGASQFNSVPLTPPTYLSTTAKQEYRRVAPLLKNLDITALDRQVLIDYCNSVAMWQDAIADIQQNGLVLEKGRKNPAVNIMLDMQKEIRANASQLGMTLDSRMKLVKPADKTEDEDPYSKVGEIQ
jgi:P27 family predicted phage terminase small subunit